MPSQLKPINLISVPAHKFKNYTRSTILLLAPRTISFPARLDALHELIAQTSDAGLELGVGLRVPLGAGAAGDSVGACEGDVEDVGGFVAVVAVHAGAEAGGGEREGGFAHQRSAAIGSVGVAPYAVDLRGN